MTTTERNAGIIAAYEEGTPLREIGEMFDLTHEGVRHVVRSSLSEGEFADLQERRTAAIKNQKERARKEAVDSLVTHLTTAYNEAGDVLTITEILGMYADATADTAREAYWTFLESLPSSRREEAQAALRSKRTNREVTWTDAELKKIAKRAFDEITASGSKFTYLAYSAWAKEQGGTEKVPGGQTLVFRLTDDGRWTSLSGQWDPTAADRRTMGPARRWDDEDIHEAIDRFVKWAKRKDRPLTRPEYVRYTQTLKSDMPSLALIRVRLGAWGPLILSKIS